MRLAARAAVDDETGALEDAKVLRHCRLRHAGLLGEAGDGLLALLRELFKKPAAGGICKRSKERVPAGAGGGLHDSHNRWVMGRRTTEKLWIGQVPLLRDAIDASR